MSIERSFAVAVIVGLGQLTARDVSANKPEVKISCWKAYEASKRFRKQQKLLEQYWELLRCSEDQCPDSIRKECEERKTAATLAIPTITFHVTDRSGKDLNNVHVTVDGALFADELTGVALPLNPGTHQFCFEVEGQPPVHKEFVILTGEKNRRESITVGNVTEESSATPPIEAPPAALPRPDLPPTANSARQPGERATAARPELQPQGNESASPSHQNESVHETSHLTRSVIAGAVAALGIGIGTALLVSAKSTYSNADCDVDSACSSETDVQMRKSAIHRANWATLPFGIGFVALYYVF